MKWAAFLRFLSWLLVVVITCANTINQRLEDGHLVLNSQDFYDTMKNKCGEIEGVDVEEVLRRSRDLVFLDGDVEVRNFYGWVFPNRSPDKQKGKVEVSEYPLRYANEGRPKIDLDGFMLHQLLTEIGRAHV